MQARFDRADQVEEKIPEDEGPKLGVKTPPYRVRPLPAQIPEGRACAAAFAYHFPSGETIDAALVAL